MASITPLPVRKALQPSVGHPLLASGGYTAAAKEAISSIHALPHVGVADIARESGPGILFTEVSRGTTEDVASVPRTLSEDMIVLYCTLLSILVPVEYQPAGVTLPV